jgi:SAM-dependent methyltransferase
MTDAFQYYQSFSLAVGTNDWRTPNMRHELLRLLVDERLHGRKRLALLDVGCGAGVMAGHLRRYGYVSAIDFSRPAVELGRELLPDVRFLVGTVDDLAEGEIFDVITLFDVFEHIRLEDRAPLFAQLDTRLAAAGQLFLSTPHPKLTAWLSTEARCRRSRRPSSYRTCSSWPDNTISSWPHTRHTTSSAPGRSTSSSHCGVRWSRAGA